MAGSAAARGVETLRNRTDVSVRARLQRVRANSWLALQTGLAAGLAWFVARYVIGHEAPFFAPIAAVVTLGVSVGQRLRRAAELVCGVALGIGVGDGLIALIGRGPLQIGVLVGLAIIVAIFLGSGSALIVQAASSAVLVATLTPSGGVSLDRLVDALVGGGVGLTVMALLLPLNPLTVVSRAATPILDVLTEGLTQTATALEGRDRAAVEAALARMRAGEADLRRFQDALAAGTETATVAPVRWRSRGALAQYVEGAEYLARALRSARVLVRRAVVLLRDDEPIPESLVRAVRSLGEAVGWLRKELAEGVEPEAARGRAITAVREAGEAYREGVAFSGSVVIAQIRSTANDILRATGARDTERTVKRTFARG